MDCPHQIPPSGNPACHHRLKSHTRHHSRLASHHHHQDRYRYSRSRSQSHPHRYHSTVAMIPTEAIPDHTIETIDITIGVLHDALTLVLIVPIVTPHITDCLHTGAHQLTLRTTTHSPFKPSKKTMHKSSSHPRRAHDKLHEKRNPRVIIDDPHRG